MVDLLANLDQTEKYILMASGAVFALAGIYMMIRPSMRDGETKIEIFGLKFNASSGGLLVFLVGTGILIGATLGPEQATSEVAAVMTTSPGESDKIPQMTNKSQTRALVLPAKAESEEKEPNNDKHAANQITRGFFYRGQIRWDKDREEDDFEDWYIALTSDLHERNLEVRIRTIYRRNGPNYENRDGNCVVNFYNDEEEIIKSM